MFTLREWAPLTDLFNKLPAKAQVGLFPQEVKVTCIDALSQFLVLGTNLGIVYWYDRKKGTLERLRCENSNCCLTVVKVTSTVDYMVACGSKDGNISIFQIPKSHPDNLPDSLKPKHNKQVERYTVSEMHNSSISALEWSRNGMKLFSGDKNGMVVLTEIDFYMHLCKSVEVLNETYEIVQLSYHQQKLLISTTYRSIICQKNQKWKVIQVGKKDRKILGNFGGIFYQTGLRPTDVILYCVRPGLRIWESDLDGIVQKTLLFKDILNTESPEVPLINPISSNMKSLKPSKEASFGKLLHFDEKSLVTFSNDVIYILNPKELTIIATISNLRSCLDVATTNDEIFILEGVRSIIRISNQPEIFDDVSSSTSKSFMQIPQSLREISSSILNTNNILPAIPPFIDNNASFNEFNEHTDETAIINAEEATEMDSRSKVLGNEDFRAKLEIYKRIGTEEFDDTILFKHSVRRSKPNNCMTSSTTSVSSNSSDSEKDNGKLIKPSIMNLSSVGLVPDLRSPDTILNDIKEKEDKLADILNIGHIKIDLNDLEKIQNDEKTETKSDDAILLNEARESFSYKAKTMSSDDNNIKSQPSAKKSDNTNETTSVIQTKLFYKDLIDEINGPPVCMNIPTEWNLKNVQIEQIAEQPDTALSDWEII